MIDLHTHTFFSDGLLGPAELVRRAKVIGYKAIAITDHVDLSNYDFVAERILQFYDSFDDDDITVIPGVEITHVRPKDIESLVMRLRDIGIKLILVHGETIVEPVESGTNKAAIDACVDIVAHPGLITDEEVKLASYNGVYLEISGRGGHSFSNGHVASLSKRFSAKLVFSTDSHKPSDLMGVEMAKRVIRSAGLTDDYADRMLRDSAEIVSKIIGGKI